MIRYTAQNQLDLATFEELFNSVLDRNNRWVKLADRLPWDELAEIYMQSLCVDNGRPTIDVRLAVGALIIKHKLKLSDREVVATIRENVYIQYFVGYQGFDPDVPFDPSLFVQMRKRLGLEGFDQMSRRIIKLTQGKHKAKRSDSSTSENSRDESNSEPPDLGASSSSDSTSDQDQRKDNPNKGYLKLDATVADQMIVHPTDLGLLARSRRESERLIDLLYFQTDLTIKPRTYRRVAHKDYLRVAKKRNKSKRLIRTAIGKQLRYLRRNLSTIERLLDLLGSAPAYWAFRDYKIYWVIQHIYRQQHYMYTNRVNRCDDRIVNIYQPYVRPIVRGKDKHKVEFGAKLGVSEFNGFSCIDRLSWNAYNESGDLIPQVEAYRELHGYYPKVVLIDQIYLTRANRHWLKQKSIRHCGLPLGRPKVETDYQRRRRRKERGMRNHVEGKFGQGKNAYGLNQIRARRNDTSEAWLGAIFLALNITRLMKLLNILIILISCLADILVCLPEFAPWPAFTGYLTRCKRAIYNYWNYIRFAPSAQHNVFAIGSRT